MASSADLTLSDLVHRSVGRARLRFAPDSRLLRSQSGSPIVLSLPRRGGGAPGAQALEAGLSLPPADEQYA